LEFNQLEERKPISSLVYFALIGPNLISISICSLIRALRPNHTIDYRLHCDCDWRLVITFQSIRAKQSPIEISHSHLENVLFYNCQSQSNRQSLVWLRL